jgi:hypothetical protein
MTADFAHLAAMIATVMPDIWRGRVCEGAKWESFRDVADRLNLLFCLMCLRGIYRGGG